MGAEAVDAAHRLVRRVQVVEVGPRDGLQHEPGKIPLEAKVALIEELAAAGLRTIEVGAFVRSDLVPQMADTGEVLKRLRPRANVTYMALVPNRRGLERAQESGVRAIAVFTASSEAFTSANIGMTVGESLRRFRDVVGEARESGLFVRGYLSTCWWCPYGGPVDPATVVRVARDLVDLGCHQLSLADTAGAATPGEVRRLLERVLVHIPVGQLSVHFHDTRGTALANVLASLELGITTVDASAGGLGQCPFAPGALGNLATEDLLYMLHGMGVDTGVDLELVRSATQRLQLTLGRQLPSRYLQAGPPPAKRG
jgi:isopropylmalate/homocitrate/citramalate synthase